MTAIVISRSPSPPTRRPSIPRRTNTLILTGLPRSYFHPSVLEALRDHFSTLGDLYAWAPISSFGRIIMVYCSEDDAERAKEECDYLTVDATSSSPKISLRVFRADPTPIISPEANELHLAPPPIEKNFLISPPGSPPIGWEHTKEDPPNSAPLADDLINALRRLQMKRDGNNVAVLIEPEEACGVGIYVQDCDLDEKSKTYRSFDGSHEESWFYGDLPIKQQRYVPIPTAMPPIPVTAW